MWELMYICMNMSILRECRKRYGVVSLFSIMRGRGEKVWTEVCVDTSSYMLSFCCSSQDMVTGLRVDLSLTFFVYSGACRTLSTS